MDVHRHQAHIPRQLPFNADNRFAQLGLREVRRQLNAARWKDDRETAERRIWIARLRDRLDSLMRAVELHRLLVGLRVEPVEEQTTARANRRLAALERRPHDAAPWREVETADLRLIFLTEPSADRQVLARAKVVLPVDAGLHQTQRHDRI